MVILSGRRITTREATVRTTSISIKSLSLNDKQVTLAVFRQLDQEVLVDPKTGALAGVPWGRVNYHPDKCGDLPEHLHVVWQKGEELRRARVDRYADAGLARHIRYLQQRISTLSKAGYSPPELVEAREQLDKLVPRLDRQEAYWHPAYTALCALDLLFIAV